MPLTLATYNVKDLFETSRERLEFLGKTLAEMDADVVGMQEIGSEDALWDLLTWTQQLGYTQRIVGTEDARGIRNVLVSRLPIVSSRVHTAATLPFPSFGVNDAAPFGARLTLRRGVVHARVRAPRDGRRRCARRALQIRATGADHGRR